MKSLWKLFILLPLFFSCEKELDFKYHDVNSQLVIEGLLSETEAKVILSYTVPMDEPLNSNKVVDAEVILSDLNDDVSFLLISEDGIFRNEIQGIPDHEYKLSVFHNGNTYESKCLMRKGVEIVDLKFQWIKMPYDHVAILEIKSTVCEKENTCYWTRIYRNGEPYKWLTSHGSGAIDGILTQTTFTTRQNLDEEDEKDILRDGDELEIMVIPISVEMYDYITAISSDSNGSPMFSGDFCLGYFLAAGISESKIVFHPDEIPYY